MAESFIQIPSVKTQFNEIIRNADQFRAPNQEELQAHKKNRPFLIITCPSEKTASAIEATKTLTGSISPLVLQSEHNWAFRYFFGQTDHPLRAEATMNNLLLHDADKAPAPTPESQSSLTAVEVLVLCTNFGWQEVHIEDGSERCKFTIWATCQVLDIPCFGFEPTDYDQTTRLKNVGDHIQSVLATHGLTFTDTPQSSPSPSGSTSDTHSDEDAT